MSKLTIFPAIALLATLTACSDAPAPTVKKEPEKYVSEHPLRSVAKLGSKEYGFVLDKKDEKSKGYDRLYFDLRELRRLCQESRRNQYSRQFQHHGRRREPEYSVGGDACVLGAISFQRSAFS